MKTILCLTCRNIDWQTLHASGVRVVDVCYFPDNEYKFGHATICDEYERKNDDEDKA